MRSLETMSARSKLVLLVVQGALIIGLLAVVLFCSAGTLDWAQAWRLLAVYTVCYLISTTLLWLKVPALIDARRTKHSGVRRWDRLLVLGYEVMYFPMFVVAGLNRRFEWSRLPSWVTVAALVLIVAFFFLITWAPLVNAHLETYVRIQTDRGHTVIDSGPYAVVRHPAYAGLALFFVGLPLALGSLWSLIPGGVAVLLLAVRTALEDRTLLAELPGYRDYAQRVRWRWFPAVW